MAKNKMEMNRIILTKRDIMVRIVDLSDQKKNELIAAYKIGDDRTIDRYTIIRILDTWFNTAVKACLHGATEEELDKLVEHIYVVMAARKYDMNISKSIDDRNLQMIRAKYRTDKTKI